MDIQKFDSLILFIKAKENISEYEICKRIGYNSTYISQVRNRGVIPEILVKRLMDKFGIEEDFIDNDETWKVVSEPISYGNKQNLPILDELIAIIKMQQETIHTLTTLLNKEKRTA